MLIHLARLRSCSSLGLSFEDDLKEIQFVLEILVLMAATVILNGDANVGL